MITHRDTRTEAHISNCPCTACAAHRRPQDVPWHQHAIGCPIRAAAVSAPTQK